jgi:hypothetical protein
MPATAGRSQEELFPLREIVPRQRESSMESKRVAGMLIFTGWEGELNTGASRLSRLFECERVNRNIQAGRPALTVSKWMSIKAQTSAH